MQISDCRLGGSEPPKCEIPVKATESTEATEGMMETLSLSPAFRVKATESTEPTEGRGCRDCGGVGRGEVASEKRAVECGNVRLIGKNV